MNELAGFTPEQGRLLWQWYLTSRQQQPHIQQNYPQRRPIDEVSPHRVFVLNTEAEVIPPYACMRVTGVDVVGGQTVVKVEKPSSTDGEFLFNCQFEIPVAGESSAGVGWAYRYGVVVMQGNGTPPTAENVQYVPVVDSWEIEEGSGPFVVFGEHNVGTGTLIGRFAMTAGGGFITFQPFDIVPGIGSICDAVVATVLSSECGSGVQIGDEVNVWDRSRSWFAMPEDLLFASVGSAHYMKVSDAERYALGDLDPGPCRWEVNHMDCIESDP